MKDSASRQVTKLSVKQIVKGLLRNQGYEIARIRARTPCPSIPSRAAGRERDSSEYDLIWSDKQFIRTTYLNDKRKELYRSLLEFADEIQLFNGVVSIADVGCGPGYLLGMVSERYRRRRLVGLDFSSAVLDAARDICKGAEFRLQDIYDPLEEKFDLLFCTEVIEHLLYPARAIENLLSAANKIVITIPDGRKDTSGAHINFWSIESWKVFLEAYENGWKCLSLYLCEGRYIVTVMDRKI